jgi:hypothetical protein
MNDATKTLVFFGVAAVIGLVAYVSRPTPAEPLADDPRGELLFDEFAATDVAQLQIVKYESKNLDVETLLTEGKLKPTSLVVKKEGESWVLPSHGSYPVDAEGKVAAAASALLGLEIEGVATDNPADHEDYGVVRPNIDRFDPEAAGVGTLVQMKDAAEDMLVNIIIGNEVKSFGDVSGQRYVRRADQDRVYIVRVNPAELSTQFKDWIKEDLLKLTAEEIRSLTLNDYAIIRNAGRAAIVPSSVSVLTKKEEKWQADSIQVREKDSPKMNERKIGKEEELDAGKIDELARALAQLKIVDVSRKPPALAEAQRQGKLVGNDEESFIALQEHGFFPNIEGGKIQIFSDQGEVIAGLESGVQYVLRFGSTAGLGDEEEEASADEAKADQEKGDENKGDAKKNGKEGDQPKKKAGLNRYIHISTQFNQDLIPKPEFEELPKLEDYLPKPKAADEPQGEGEKKAADAENAAEKPGEEANGEAPQNGQPEEAKPDDARKDSGANLSTTENTAKLTQSDAKDEQPQDAAADDDTAKDDAAKDETEKEDSAKEEAKEEAAKEETAPEDKADQDKPEDNEQVAEESQPAEGDEPKPAAEGEKEKPKEKPKKTPEELAKEKFEKDVARINKDNEKKRTEYEEKLGKSRELVDHLNARFADWFYVISESEYEKIHLTANDLIKKKGAPEQNADGALPPGHPPAGGFQVPGAGLRDFPGAPE